MEVEATRFHDSRLMKAVRLSAVCTGHLYPPRNIPGIRFCLRLSRHQGHSAAGRIMPMKNVKIYIYSLQYLEYDK